MKLTKIPYITLWVKNFENTINFYENILGLKVKDRQNNLIRFQTQGTKLYIHRIIESDSPLRENTVDLHFKVSDVDKAYKQLKQKGVTFEQLPENMPWGTRQAHFRDPEGYRIELVGPIKPTENRVFRGTENL